MLKDIEFSPQDRYILLFKKSFWSPEEMATVQSLELGFHEPTLTASADLRSTSRRAIFEFLSYSFKNFMGNPQFQLHRQQLFDELRTRYWELACAFENEFLTKLNYPKPLFAHQKESAQFISERQHALAALEQGLGKTITAATVSRIHNIARTIVVCPAVVKWNWFRDLTDDWGYNPMYFTILDATKRRTVKAFIERFVIINFDIVKDNLDYLVSKPTGHIILDEVHVVKNHNTAKFKAVQKLLWAFPEARVTYLSGTPVKNRVNDLFAYLKLSNHFLGQNHSAFLKEYTHQKKGGLGKGQVTGGKNLDDLYLKISNFMIRKVKEECLDLPDKLISKYYFQLDEWQAEYDKALKHMATFKDVSNIHSALHTLNIIVAKSKVKGIIELIDSIVDAGRKPLIFSSYTEPLEILEKHYKEQCVKITGATDSYQRDQLVQKFKNDENVTVFLGNMIAAGVGINLTNSSDVIFMNFPFTPADLHQAIDRTHRIGQKNIVNVYYTICEESIDEHLFALISDKAADINALIDKGKPTIEYESIPNQLFKKLLEKYKNGEEPSEQVSAESTNGGIQRSLPESYFGE